MWDNGIEADLVQVVRLFIILSICVRHISMHNVIWDNICVSMILKSITPFRLPLRGVTDTEKTDFSL